MASSVVIVLAIVLLGGVAHAQSPDELNVKSKRPGVINLGKGDKGNKPKVDAKDKKTAKDKGDKTEANNPLDGEEVKIDPNFDPPLGEEKPIPGRQKITIDFRKAELEDVVKFFSKLLKKNFIIADSLKAGKKITIIAPKQVSVQEAYRAFLAALAMNGLTIVPHGAFLKIVDSKSALHEDIPTRIGTAGVARHDLMETRIVTIEHVSQDDVQKVLSKIKSKDAEILTYPQTNTLIITEYSTNLRRMFRIIKFLDQPTGADKIHIYQVQYADASELAGTLGNIFEVGDKRRTSSSSSKRKSKSKKSSSSEGSVSDISASKIIADENTNQLIIVTNDRAYKKIVELIEKLDVETNAGRIWVYPLENADAEELAQVLSTLAGQNQSQSRRRPGTSNRDGGKSKGGTSSKASGAALLSGDVQVTADPPTNSLIVVASFKDYVAVRTVVDDLDKRRKQVYVEAAVLEVALNRQRRFGIGMNAGVPRTFDFIPESDAIGDEGLILGQANFQGSKLLEAIQGQGGLGLGVIGPSVTIPGTEFSLPAFLFFLEANQTDQDVNILSTPSILTLNNEEAEISVGERVPFLSNSGLGGGLGSLGGLGGLLGGAGGTTGTSGLGGLGGLGALGALGGLGGLGGGVNYEDVALTLRITPQISSSGLVRLEVDLDVDEIKPGAGDTLTPTRTTRSAKTVVVAEDQQTIVIGGLMRDVENEGVVKVPFLGDIPLLGVFFRRSDKTITKQNLVLLLTPYIIESSDDIKRITDQKNEERQHFIELFGRRDKEYIPEINFNRKHGLLEEINQKVGASQTMEQARRDAYGKTFPRAAAAPEGEVPSKAPAPKAGEDDIIVSPKAGQ